MEKHRGVVFNTLFGFYLFFLQPVVFRSADGLIVGEKTAPAFGVILITILVLETIGLQIKLPSIDREGEYGAAFGLWTFHVGVSVMLTMAAFEALGLYPSAEPSGSFVAVTMIIIMLREIYLLFFMLGGSLKRRSNKALWTGDLFLLIYATIAYTTLWETLSSRSSFGLSSYIGSGEIIVQTSAAIVLFLMLFLPMRTAFILEELDKSTTKKDKTGLFLSYTVVVAGAIIPLFFR
jgi:hypothetical protein